MQEKISEIEIVPIQPRNGLIGFCSFVWDNALKVSSVGIHTKLDGTGYRLLFPAGKFGNTCFPISENIGEYITKKISEKVDQIIMN